MHAFSNPHDAVARALVINTPDIGVDYFRDVAAVVNAGAPLDKARLVATMQRYGLTPATAPAPAPSSAATLERA